MQVKALNRYSFWLIATFISALMILFTIKYFSSAFPIVHLNLTMNRSQALEEASILAKRFHNGPSEYTQATSFDTDMEVQTFVELEGGGKSAFINMMESHLYEPYYWSVRHFKEFNPNETMYYFTPDGKFYGFSETLSENAPGAYLNIEEAQKIAEEFAASSHQNLSAYTLIESSKEVTPKNVLTTLLYTKEPMLKLAKKVSIAYASA